MVANNSSHYSSWRRWQLWLELSFRTIVEKFRRTLHSFTNSLTCQLARTLHYVVQIVLVYFPFHSSVTRSFERQWWLTYRKPKMARVRSHTRRVLSYWDDNSSQFGTQLWAPSPPIKTCSQHYLGYQNFMWPYVCATSTYAMTYVNTTSFDHDSALINLKQYTKIR